MSPAAQQLFRPTVSDLANGSTGNPRPLPFITDNRRYVRLRVVPPLAHGFGAKNRYRLRAAFARSICTRYLIARLENMGNSRYTTWPTATTEAGDSQSARVISQASIPPPPSGVIRPRMQAVALNGLIPLRQGTPPRQQRPDCCRAWARRRLILTLRADNGRLSSRSKARAGRLVLRSEVTSPPLRVSWVTSWLLVQNAGLGRNDRPPLTLRDWSLPPPATAGGTSYGRTIETVPPIRVTPIMKPAMMSPIPT